MPRLSARTHLHTQRAHLFWLFRVPDRPTAFPTFMSRFFGLMTTKTNQILVRVDFAMHYTIREAKSHDSFRAWRFSALTGRFDTLTLSVLSPWPGNIYSLRICASHSIILTQKNGHSLIQKSLWIQDYHVYCRVLSLLGAFAMITFSHKLAACWIFRAHITPSRMYLYV